MKIVLDMTSANVKIQEKDDVVIEETSTGEKRKHDGEFHSKSSPNKYHRTSDSRRSPPKTTANQRDFLSVPFWKHLNNDRICSGFQPTEIGSFSLLTRDNEKECFEDNRYRRGRKFFYFNLKSIK